MLTQTLSLDPLDPNISSGRLKARWGELGAFTQKNGSKFGGFFGEEFEIFELLLEMGPLSPRM